MLALVVAMIRSGLPGPIWERVLLLGVTGFCALVSVGAFIQTHEAFVSLSLKFVTGGISYRTLLGRRHIFRWEETTSVNLKSKDEIGLGPASRHFSSFQVEVRRDKLVGLEPTRPVSRHRPHAVMVPLFAYADPVKAYAYILRNIFFSEIHTQLPYPVPSDEIEALRGTIEEQLERMVAQQTGNLNREDPLADLSPEELRILLQKTKRHRAVYGVLAVLMVCVTICASIVWQIWVDSSPDGNGTVLNERMLILLAGSGLAGIAGRKFLFYADRLKPLTQMLQGRDVSSRKW